MMLWECKILPGRRGRFVLLAALLALAACDRGDDKGPQPGNDFDPAMFVASRPHLDAPYVATDSDVVDAMLGMAAVRPDDYVIDLGSGDGRILIAAARSAGARGLGVDIDPARVREASANADAAGVGGKVSFRRQDLFNTPLAEADVLTLYLSNQVNQRLRPRILAEMQPGARVVSNDYDMGDWHWDQRRRVGDDTIFLWTVPARVGGAWTMNVNGHSFPVTIAQSYQQFTGTIGDIRIEQGHLNGVHIRFVAHFGEGGRHVFEGQVDGDHVVPHVANEGWRLDRAAQSTPSPASAR